MSFTKLNYCQYWLRSQVNYTLMHLAEPLQHFSHDTANHYLRGQQLSPRLLWESVRDKVQATPQGYLHFDATVRDKSCGPCIELTCRQYSANIQSVMRGIGLVSCVYLNAATQEFWVIEYRLFAPERDGKTKLDHAQEMLAAVVRRGFWHGVDGLLPVGH